MQRRGNFGRRLISALGILAAINVASLLAAEAVLRVGYGLPKGTFKTLIRGENGLYPPHAELQMVVGGPKPYVVKTNSLGLRGDEVAIPKPPGTVRIAALGDSVTNGFYVENDETYPHYLAQKLSALDRKAEVLNLARGRGSIGEAFAQFRDVALPLGPDVAILTFVTNDIAELRGQSLESATNVSLKEELGDAILAWLIANTAVGEWGASSLLRRLASKREDLPPNGAEDFAANTEYFLARYHNQDGIILTDTPSPETVRLLALYRDVLTALNALAKKHGVTLVIVYAPSYDQLYGTNPSSFIRTWLRKTSDDLEIPFIDVTEVLREDCRGKAIHFAPLDFHFTPEGNRLFAARVGERLGAILK